jgi:hypothetical protein
MGLRELGRMYAEIMGSCQSKCRGRANTCEAYTHRPPTHMIFYALSVNESARKEQ